METILIVKTMAGTATPIADKYATLKTDDERAAFRKKILDAALAEITTRMETDVDPTMPDKDMGDDNRSVRTAQDQRSRASRLLARVSGDDAFRSGRVDEYLKIAGVMGAVMPGGRRRRKTRKTRRRMTRRRR